LYLKGNYKIFQESISDHSTIYRWRCYLPYFLPRRYFLFSCIYHWCSQSHV